VCSFALTATVTVTLTKNGGAPMSDEINISAPSLGRSIGTYRRMHWTRLKRGRLRYALVVLLLLPVGAAAAALGFERAPFDYVLELYFRFLTPFLPALGASAIVSEEIDAKTFTFIFARPAPRWAMVLGKFVAFTAPLVVGFALSLALTYGVASLRGGVEDFTGGLGHFARVLGVVLLGVVMFSAVTSLVGSWFTRSPFMGAIGYVLLIEWIFSFVPFFKLLTITWHLRNLAAFHVTSVFMISDARVPLWASAAAVCFLGLLSMFGAAGAVSGAEYRTDR
jgi:ABC-type transport system involved in multi-copper enzyme maturation permease subunit